MTAPLIVGKPTELPPLFQSKDEALGWLISLVEKCEVGRLNCNVRIPGDDAKTAKEQTKAWHAYLLYHGQALGAAMALLRDGTIDENAYAQLTDRVRRSLMPSMTGQINVGVQR